MNINKIRKLTNHCDLKRTNKAQRNWKRKVNYYLRKIKKKIYSEAKQGHTSTFYFTEEDWYLIDIYAILEDAGFKCSFSDMNSPFYHYGLKVSWGGYEKESKD